MRARGAMTQGMHALLHQREPNATVGQMRDLSAQLSFPHPSPEAIPDALHTAIYANPEVRARLEPFPIQGITVTYIPRRGLHAPEITVTVQSRNDTQAPITITDANALTAIGRDLLPPGRRVQTILHPFAAPPGTLWHGKEPPQRVALPEPQRTLTYHRR